MDARELRKFLRDFKVGSINESYTELLNATIDYGNDTGDWQFEDYFNDFADDEIVAMQVKDWADSGDIQMIKNYLEDVNLDNGVYYVDGYGWLRDVDDSDLYYIRDEILSELEDEDEDYEDEEEDEDYE